MSAARLTTEFDVFGCPLEGANLIEASAGTGKTWNICGLYLRLLLERELDVRELLVVTFTNAATAELRERIRTRIVETLAWLDGTTGAAADPFVARLVEATERRGIDRETMRRRLDLALERFDEAAVFTIHGFCQRALADAPFAARLPLTQELLPDDGDALAEAVRDFWRRHVAGDAMTPELAAYLVQKKDSPERWAALLKRRLAKPLAQTRFPEDLDEADELPGAELTAAYAAARELWRTQREEALAVLLGTEALNRNSYSEEAIRQGARDWDAFFRCGDALAPLGGKTKLYGALTIGARTKKNQTAPTHPFFDTAETFVALRVRIDRALERARLRLLRRLLIEAETALRAKKREQRVVSFDDMLYNLWERLHGGDCPWLAPAVRQRFPAALIDEFQDTDPLQFAIFRAVYGGSEAPLFYVGDPKQAIYRFRHADLHTYLKAKREARATYSLAENQRSSPGLIAALNALFAANPRAFMLADLDYVRVGVGAKPRKVFDDRSAPRADLQLWMLPNAGQPLNRSDAKAAAAQATAAEISRLLAAATAGEVALDGRPLRSGDIAVLVRSRADGALVRNALAALGIGSVELAQTSLWRTSDAEEVARVLAAILEPNRERLLRAALATELLGCDAAEIDALAQDEARWMEYVLRFAAHRDTWRTRGVGVMLRRLLDAEDVPVRMLARPDGERRLTNLLHLAECLHQAAETHRAPDALLAWLEARRREGVADETSQLRLESDRNLVQIVTIHKSKGLEYPVVFCPFLWDGHLPRGSHGEGLEYHDENGNAVFDLRPDARDDEANKRSIRLEESAEILRLIYVALTRAVHRCYLVAGCYQKGSTMTESTHSLLNWLVAGAGQTPQEWLEAKLAPDTIDAAWTQLATNCAAHVGRMPLPTEPGAPLAVERPAPGSLAALPPPAAIPEGWRIGSYSSLSHGAAHENAASDHDARAVRAPASAPPNLPPDDILRFPRGPAAGDCIHAVMERVDFADAASWPAAIAQALRAFPQRASNEAAARLPKMLAGLLGDLVGTELAPGLRLSAVPTARRLTELEFALPVGRLADHDVNALLRDHGYAAPRLGFGALAGYLKGFIDLVFEHDGRWYLLDWKSNHLGFEPRDYANDALAEAMREHGYHLQYLLYAVALERYLKRRLPGYDHATHFGGVLYLFVRGVRPEWRQDDGTPAGVFFHRPEAETIRRLDDLLGATP